MPIGPRLWHVGAVLIAGVPLARAAYPLGPQITDRAASEPFTLMLQDFATVPHSINQGSSSQTASQVARINFLRAEPMPSLASQRLFAPDLNGNLYILDRSTRTFTPYIDFPSIFNGTSGTGTFDNSPGFAAGVVTIQFDPDYANNGKFYTVHTELDGNSSGYRQAVLEEWHDTNINDQIFEGTHAELLRVQYSNNVHPMGDIVFDPLARDASNPDWRNMYIASGDGGAGESITSSIRNQDQMLDNLLGKILRIKPSDSGTPGTYSIPADNPFQNQTWSANIRPEIYAYGFRNPHRLSWDVDPNNPANNHLIVNNIGLHSYEEINIVHPGANYGYSALEGNQVLGSNNQVNNSPLPASLPIYTDTTSSSVGSIIATWPSAMYSHRDGDAISGGFVYRGTLLPQLVGKYVFGDISTGRLFYCDYNELLNADSLNDPQTLATIHELQVFYSSPYDDNGLLPRRVFDIVRDEFHRRNDTPIGSILHDGDVDADPLPGGANATAGDDPYGIAYGGGRADIRLALIDDELYLLSKSDGMIRLITEALPGDSNLDGIVDVTDLGALATNWQAGGAWKGGDFNHDGFVDVSDLGILATHWQQSGQDPGFDQAIASLGLSGAVPEPAGLPALVLALVAAQLRIRAGRRAATRPHRRQVSQAPVQAGTG